jgi:hypothetical protein
VNEKAFLKNVQEKRSSGEETVATLQTDERVLARISDGIYRQPASALRELIANAYDADANLVSVKTDAPRFSKIVVEDDGVGMSEATLVRMIHHIGGSAKRTEQGAGLGITSETDPDLSPGGRRLIGKIGIGLFSVAQLTRSFRVLTKQAGDAYRLVAEVDLVSFSDQHAATGSTKTGTVRVRSVPAKKGEHGTRVELINMQPAAREFLQSHDVWQHVYNAETDEDDKFSPPAIHIGRLNADSEETIERSDALPWENRDSPETRFKKLIRAVQDERSKSNANPKLDEICDRYFQTIWSLSLSLPLKYLGGTHPFDLPGEKLPQVFQLSNKSGGQPTELKLSPRQTLRKELKLEAVSPEDFEVIFDGVALRRPLDFSSDDPQRPPLLFVGRFGSDFKSVPDDAAGGKTLAIEAYFVWKPKVVPVDHIGLLVRIADASGTLFDPTYFSYQVAEKTRLRQISGELFAIHGLDPALNIDRESFNFGHPHAKVVSLWVHRALRQVANVHKKVQSDSRAQERDAEAQTSQKEIWKIVRDDVGRAPERVAIEEDEEKVRKLREKGKPAVSQAVVFEGVEEPRGTVGANKREVLAAKVAAIATLLQEYGLWERLKYQQQEKLLRAITQILESK